MSARLQPVDVATAQGRTHELFTTIKSKFGKVPNMMKTMGHAPAALEGYLGLAGALANGGLPGALREQLALAVSQANGCEYCVSAHTLTGKLAGLTPEQIVAARQGQADNPRSQAALDLALNVREARGNISDLQLADAREAGLSDADITEVVAHVALNTFTNFFNQLVHTDVDFPKVSLAL